jgi:hypothetical protein
MKEWVMINVEAMFDSIRYKWYDFAFKYNMRKARSHWEYAIRADICLDKMDAILTKWEKMAKEMVNGIES